MVGENKEIQFRIEEAQNNYIDLSKLKLRITKTRASGTKVYYNGKEVVGTLNNQDEANFTNTAIRLSIEPGISLHASVDLQLEYGGKPLGNILTFTWGIGESQANKALLEAVKTGDKERIEALFQLPKVNVNIADNNGNTPLHLAVKGGNKEIVKTLLKANNINLELKNHQFGHTPLHESIHQGNLEVITALICQGANVNTTSKMFNETPLFLAVIKIGRAHV